MIWWVGAEEMREKKERERYLETFRKDDVSFVMPKMVG